MSRAARLAQKAQSILDQADHEGRVLSGEERSYVAEILNEAREVGEHEKSLADLGIQLGGGNVPGNGAFFENMAAANDPGSRFIQSEGFKSIADASRRGSDWSTGPIEVTGPPAMQLKGTLTEGTGAPGSGTGGGFLPVPAVVPGVVDVLWQPLSVERALSSGVATAPTVRYIQQGTATNMAAGVLEGGTKPESALGIGAKDEYIRKVATFLPLSDEILEDAPAIQSWVNGQLIQFVNLEVERQLLRGTGGNEIQGLLNGRGVPVYSGGTAAGNKGIQLFKAFNSVRGSAYVEPDFAILSPSDYEAIRTLQDNQGQLYGGGPFFGPYGNGTPAAASGQVTGATDSLWGKPCYVTNALGAGTALIGNSQAARVMSLGGARVEFSNSHGSFFQQDLVAVRAERRVGVCLFRPGALCEVHLA